MVNQHERAITDDALIRDVLGGHVESFGELVEAYAGRLYNAVARMVGNADDAEDIVQETFLQAFRKLDTFRANSSFYTWIYRIAVNAAINFHRRTKKTVSLSVHPDPGRELAVDDDEQPAHRLESQEEAARVQAGLMRLSTEHRQILVMREIDDLSYEQIADILGMPVGTVRSRLHRARLQLKELLWPTENTAPGHTCPVD